MKLMDIPIDQINAIVDQYVNDYLNTPLKDAFLKVDVSEDKITIAWGESWVAYIKGNWHNGWYVDLREEINAFGSLYDLRQQIDRRYMLLDILTAIKALTKEGV